MNHEKLGEQISEILKEHGISGGVSDISMTCEGSACRFEISVVGYETGEPKREGPTRKKDSERMAWFKSQIPRDQLRDTGWIYVLDGKEYRLQQYDLNSYPTDDPAKFRSWDLIPKEEKDFDDWFKSIQKADQPAADAFVWYDAQGNRTDDPSNVVRTVPKAYTPEIPDGYTTEAPPNFVWPHEVSDRLLGYEFFFQYTDKDGKPTKDLQKAALGQMMGVNNDGSEFWTEEFKMYNGQVITTNGAIEYFGTCHSRPTQSQRFRTTVKTNPIRAKTEVSTGSYKENRHTFVKNPKTNSDWTKCDSANPYRMSWEYFGIDSGRTPVGTTKEEKETELNAARVLPYDARQCWCGCDKGGGGQHSEQCPKWSKDRY